MLRSTGVPCQLMSTRAFNVEARGQRHLSPRDRLLNLLGTGVSFCLPSTTEKQQRGDHWETSGRGQDTQSQGWEQGLSVGCFSLEVWIFGPCGWIILKFKSICLLLFGLDRMKAQGALCFSSDA